jgi:putative cell wall-binding protein
VAGCPIILVDGLAAAANTATKAEIVRLTQGQATRTVYIAGSPSVVSTGLATSLGSGLGTVVVARLAGTDRYGTANEIAKRARILMTSKGIAYGGKALMVTGADYHDALLAGPLAYRSRIPLLLVGASVTTALTNTMATVGVNKVEIIGSTTWVPATVATALGTALGASNVTRPCSIADPYAQSVAVADRAVSSYGFSWSGVGIATGENYPDALGAAPVQGRAGNPLLYTQAASATSSVAAALAAHKFQISLLRYFGSTGAVSQGVRNGLEAALK